MGVDQDLRDPGDAVTHRHVGDRLDQRHGPVLPQRSPLRQAFDKRRHELLRERWYDCIAAASQQPPCLLVLKLTRSAMPWSTGAMYDPGYRLRAPLR